MTRADSLPSINDLYKLAFARTLLGSTAPATPRRSDIVAGGTCLHGCDWRATSMRSHRVTQLRQVWLLLPGTRTELWPVAADTRQHASSFNPSPDPEPRSAFLPLPAFPSNSVESYDFWERMVDVWLYASSERRPVLLPLSATRVPSVFFRSTSLSLSLLRNCISVSLSAIATVELICTRIGTYTKIEVII